jgi:tetratricopeptide (TPR) repeat protein
MTSTIDGLISKKEYEAAYARLQALLAKSPEDPTLIERLGNCCYLWGLGLFWGEKRYDEGLTRCREAAAAYEALGSRPIRRGKGREPASESAARCRCMEGVNLSALGDHAQAAETLESVSNSRNETGARAARARGIALTRLGQWKEADACFATAAKWYARRSHVSSSSFSPIRKALSMTL